MLGLTLLIVLFVHCQGNTLNSKGLSGISGGQCPYQRPVVACESNFFFLSEESSCHSDNECSSSLKCCQKGCVSKCVEPVHYSNWCTVPLDVGILFDSKFGELSWKVKKMIYKVVRRLSLKEDHTHVSLATITNTRILTTFARNANLKKLWKILKTVKPAMTHGNLSSALNMAKTMFSKENGGRKDAIKVLLVFADGDTSPDEDISLLEMASNVLQEAGILVETIAIGEELDLYNLVQIATSDRYVWDKVDQEFLQDLKKLEKEPCS